MTTKILGMLNTLSKAATFGLAFVHPANNRLSVPYVWKSLTSQTRTFGHVPVATKCVSRYMGLKYVLLT